MTTEQKIKLKPKQLASLQAIQAKKAQLNSMFQDLSTQEATILEIVLEDVQINGVIAGAKIEEDSLVLSITEKPKAKEKSKKAPVVEQKAESQMKVTKKP